MSTAELQGKAHAMVLQVSLPKGADPATASSMVEALEMAMAVLVDTGQASVIERADRLAELATGMLDPNIELVEDRVYRMKTVHRVFADGDWLTAEQINALQAEPPANKSHPASDWKRRARIFSVNYGGKEYFARYRHQPPVSLVSVQQAGQVLRVQGGFGRGSLFEVGLLFLSGPTGGVGRRFVTEDGRRHGRFVGEGIADLCGSNAAVLAVDGRYPEDVAQFADVAGVLITLELAPSGLVHTQGPPGGARDASEERGGQGRYV